MIRGKKDGGKKENEMRKEGKTLVEEGREKRDDNCRRRNALRGRSRATEVPLQ